MDEQAELVVLLRRFRVGDSDAVCELSCRLGPSLRVVVRRHLGAGLRAQFDTDDFVQDVWAKLLSVPPDRYAFETLAALRGFLSRVARDLVIDAARHRAAAHLESVGNESSPALDRFRCPDPEPVEWVIAGEVWKRWLGRLPMDHRPVAGLLREGYTYDEIAGMAGVSTRTIKRIARRLKELATFDM